MEKEKREDDRGLREEGESRSTWVLAKRGGETSGRGDSCKRRKQRQSYTWDKAQAVAAAAAMGSPLGLSPKSTMTNVLGLEQGQR